MKSALFKKTDVFLLIIMVIWIAVIIAVLAACITTTVAVSQRLVPIYSVKTEEKEIALTFNCAWDDSTTDGLLEILNEYDIKCTFFFVGDFAEKYPESVRKIYNRGHTIGNHSMHHNDPVKQEYDEIISDIARCNDVLYSLTGFVPTLYRAPSGSYDNKTIEAAGSLGMTVIQWDVDSVDWKNPSPQQIVDKVLSKSQEGSIVLFHLGKENTLDAIENVIILLKEDGYSFCNVTELLLEGDTYIDAEGRQQPS